MFNVTGSEIIILLLLALIVLGPEKLPDAIRRFGKIYGELRRMGQGFQDELRDALDEPMRELRSTADMARRAIEDPADEVSQTAKGIGQTATDAFAAATKFSAAPVAGGAAKPPKVVAADPDATETTDAADGATNDATAADGAAIDATDAGEVTAPVVVTGDEVAGDDAAPYETNASGEPLAPYETNAPGQPVPPHRAVAAGQPLNPDLPTTVGGPLNPDLPEPAPAPPGAAENDVEADAAETSDVEESPRA